MNATVDFLLSEVYGHPVKVIIFSRHGDKTLDNHITLECLNEIMMNGMPGLTHRINTIQHGSACVRSDETASAAAIWILKNGGKITKHLSADPRLGSDEIFAELFNPEIKNRMKENGWKNYETIVKANSAGSKKFEKGVAEAIYEMFAQMKPGDIALSANHSPTVETAYNYFVDPKHRDEQMAIASLDGIILVQVETDEGTGIFAHR